MVRHMPGVTRDGHAGVPASLIRLRGCSDPRQILRQLQVVLDLAVGLESFRLRERKRKASP